MSNLLATILKYEILLEKLTCEAQLQILELEKLPMVFFCQFWKFLLVSLTFLRRRKQDGWAPNLLWENEKKRRFNLKLLEREHRKRDNSSFCLQKKVNRRAIESNSIIFSEYKEFFKRNFNNKKMITTVWVSIWIFKW